MIFETPLAVGTLVQRVNRFVARVRLPGHGTVAAHVANTGSMTGCMLRGGPVALSHHGGRGRKLEWSWELSYVDHVWVCVNTSVPNRLVHEALRAGKLGPLRGYQTIRREVRHGARSRLDFLLEGRRGRCWVEVKNVTLVQGRVALFPDAVTERGARHLDELADIRASGERAVVLFVVNRPDATRVGPASHVDPHYARRLSEVVAAGVEALAYRTIPDLEGIRIDRKLPVSP